MKNQSAQYEKITPELARQYLTKNVRNRTLNEDNLRGIELEMRRGVFHNTGESIKFDKDGNMIDGQHRLTAIMKTGISQTILVVRGLDEDAYKYIDTGRTRRANDVLAMEGVANSNSVAPTVKFILNWKRHSWSSAAKGVQGTRRMKITNAEISEFYNKHSKSVMESLPYGYNKKNKVYNRPQLSGLHYILKSYDYDGANDFCYKLYTGESLTQKSPIHMLREKLIQDMRAVKKLPSLHKLALVLKAWNLYVADEHVSQLKWDSTREPFPKPIAKKA